MKDIRRLLHVLVALCLTCTVALSVTGCDQLTGGDESDDDDNDSRNDKDKDKDKDKSDDDDDDATPAASSSAEPEADKSADEVASYPEQKAATGDYKLLKPLKARQAADDASKEQTELSSGTLVTMKQTYQEWSLIEYPGDAGSMKSGWVHAQPDKNKDTFEASSASPSQSAKPQPSSAQPAKSTQPPAKSADPKPKPSASSPPFNPLNPCGCKLGDVACAIRCAQQGGKKK